MVNENDTHAIHVPSLRILLVEDDDDTRAVLALSICSLGHDCRAVPDGHAALATLEDSPVDVVISDWQLPGMTGADLCRQIRAKEETGSYTYFIFATAHHDRERLLEGMAAGADDYQRKPLDLDDLEARLVAAARVVALHRRLAERENSLKRDSSTLWVTSRIDALTGVGNRRGMDEDLSACWCRHERYKHPCTIAVLDLDRFKDVNDTFGHLAGDEALKEIARVIRGCIRSSDSLFRYGGEEFLVLFPEQAMTSALTAVERIRHDIGILGVPRSRRGDSVTVSAGVAELDRAIDDSIPTWLGRADTALYFAKNGGRNRVVTAAAPPHDPHGATYGEKAWSKER